MNTEGVKNFSDNNGVNINQKNLMARILHNLNEEKVLFALIPFVGSLVAFLFEAGFLSFFDVPVTFLQLDFARIVTASGYVTIAIAGLLMLISFAAEIGKGRHPILKVISKALIPVIFFGAFFVLFSTDQAVWMLLVGFMCFIILLELLPPIFQRSSSNKYWDRVAIAVNSKSEDSKDGGKLDKIVTSIGFLGFASMYVFLLGVHCAQEKTRYWVLNDQKELLLVANYGDTLILKKFDPAKKELANYLEIRKISDSLPIQLTVEKIGKLQPTKAKQ